MTTVLGPNTRGVLHLISHLRRLDAERIDAVAEAWKRRSARARARARAAVAHAALARDAAMTVASRHDRADWAFWVAAWDAAMAVAMGGMLTDRDYQELVGPLASVMPWLAVERPDRIDAAGLRAALGQWGGTPR